MLTVKKILSDRKITYRDLANSLGVSATAVSLMINGNPTLSTLERIAAALGVPVVDLFDRPAGSDADTVCPHCGKPIHVHLG